MNFLSCYKVSNSLKILRKRIEKIKELAKRHICTIILKEHIDVVGNGKEVVINKTGREYMTKGGFRDILSDIYGKFEETAVEKFKESLIVNDVFEFFYLVC